MWLTWKPRSGPFDQLGGFYWSALFAERTLVKRSRYFRSQIVRVRERLGKPTRIPILRFSQKLGLSRLRLQVGLDQDSYGAMVAGLQKLLMGCRQARPLGLAVAYSEKHKRQICRASCLQACPTGCVTRCSKLLRPDNRVPERLDRTGGCVSKHLHTSYHGRYEDTHHETRSYRASLLFMGSPAAL